MQITHISVTSQIFGTKWLYLTLATLYAQGSQNNLDNLMQLAQPISLQYVDPSFFKRDLPKRDLPSPCHRVVSLDKKLYLTLSLSTQV